MALILETSLGDLTIDLYTDERPRACTNFLKLCKIKYYNTCLFHTIQRNVVAQSGDPDGRGGQSIFTSLYGDQAAHFEAEMLPKIKHWKRGMISMVNNGSNMHGSQFCITLEENLDYLDQQAHTVFGEVTEGEEILDKLNELYCDREGKPYQNIRILHTVIIDDPFPDPPGLDIPPSSPLPDVKNLGNGRLEYDDEIDPFKGKTEDEIRELQAEKEAKANAQILEMIGDLPNQDVAPEDNVLFVCKLNPVTTDEDLEIIFSRFGDIKSCEVIRDQKSGESLQYAFIEFAKAEYCENAYFKMDNVLIDDRRIHVDFSQSVAKVKWKGKGKGVQKVNEDKPKASAAPGRLYGMDFDSWTSKKKTDHKSDRRRHDRSPDRHRKRSRSPRPRRGSRSNRSNRRSSSPDHRDKKRSHSDRHSHKSRTQSRERKRSRSGQRPHLR